METPFQNGVKVPMHSMPSDYSDVQPKSYDPEFISQISSQMQVPDRIGVNNDERSNGMSSIEKSGSDGLPFSSGMMVPDRILVAGDNQHIGAKSDLALQLNSSEGSNQHHSYPEGMSYVGMLTPPRTLTMEESFPVISESPKEETTVVQSRGDSNSNEKTINNGHIMPPSPYDPGVNPNDSLLLCEEDEVIMLRHQMSKLVRRVNVIEEEQKKRAQREFVVYPVILGYFLWKVLGWLVRDSRG